MRAAYDANLAGYTTPEERSAAHILIAVAADAPQARATRRKQKAEAIAEEVQGEAGELRRAREGEVAGSGIGAAGR